MKSYKFYLVGIIGIVNIINMIGDSEKFGNSIGPVVKLDFKVFDSQLTLLVVAG